MAGQRTRSTLPKDEARRRYIELAELAVLEQIRADAETLDRESIPVGPFARLDANALAASVGKTRGSITNLFGSQAALQAETMDLAMSARDWIDRIEYPEPGTTRRPAPGSMPCWPPNPPAVRSAVPTRPRRTPSCGRSG